MKFNPVNFDGQCNKDVEEEQQLIKSAKHMIVITPIYWFDCIFYCFHFVFSLLFSRFSFPAILKGYIDRVFSYGFAYEITASGSKGLLKHMNVQLVWFISCIWINQNNHFNAYFQYQSFLFSNHRSLAQAAQKISTTRQEQRNQSFRTLTLECLSFVGFPWNLMCGTMGSQRQHSKRGRRCWRMFPLKLLLFWTEYNCWFKSVVAIRECKDHPQSEIHLITF